MLEISVTKIKGKTDELRKQIRRYEEYSLTIAQQIQNSEAEWHDDNSAAFFDLVKNQKRVVMEFIDELDGLRNKYIDIVNVVQKSNRTIKELYVNEGKQKGIIYYYDENISTLNKIKTALKNLDTTDCTSGEKININNEINRIGRAITKLENSKKNIESLFTQYAAMETTIKGIISKIDIVPIKLIDLGNFYN